MEWFILIVVMLAAVNLGLGLLGVIWLVRMCRRDDRAGPPPAWTWGWLWRIADRRVDAWHARRAKR